MTNIIGFGRTQLQLQPDAQVRNPQQERGKVHGLQTDRLALSDEAATRLEGLPEVDAPELTHFADAMQMARSTVQLFLDRPDQARVSHVPDLGARVAGLVG